MINVAQCGKTRLKQRSLRFIQEKADLSGRNTTIRMVCCRG
jgi:hypothetical protein